MPGVGEVAHRLREVGVAWAPRTSGVGSVGRRNHPGQMGRPSPTQVSVEAQRTR